MSAAGLDLRDRSTAIRGELVRWRRRFHENPEPGFGEFQTATAVAGVLESLDLHVRIAGDAMDRQAVLHRHAERIEAAYQRARQAGLADALLRRMLDGGTAVVADLDTGRPGPTVAFRVDMDCLPITEADGDRHTPARDGFRSTVDGEMHACGHDGHMAIGLGAATLLSDLRDRLCGRVRFIFQPAEEGVPGGAAAIAARGLVDDVDYLVAVHIGLGAPRGTLVARTYFLATTKYVIRFRGAPAHVTNEPQSGRNALLAAASTALALHGIAPHSGGWFSLYVGVLHAGDEQGVTPAWATMQMGFSSENMTAHDYVDARVREVVHGTAAAWGVDVEMTCIGRAPTALDQSDELAAVARRVCEQELPHLTVTEEASCKAGEDACLLLERVREAGGHGLFVLLGTELADGHHTSSFDFDEDALVTGATLLTGIAADILARS